MYERKCIGMHGFHFPEMLLGLFNPFYMCFESVEEGSHHTLDIAVDMLTTPHLPPRQGYEHTERYTDDSPCHQSQQVATDKTEEKDVHLLEDNINGETESSPNPSKSLETRRRERRRRRRRKH